MRLFMFALFIVVWAGIGLTYYYKQTNQGKKENALGQLDDAKVQQEIQRITQEAAEILNK